MPKRIYPSQLRNPDDLCEVFRMLDTWVGAEHMPKDVRAIWAAYAFAVSKQDECDSLLRSIEAIENRRHSWKRDVSEAVARKVAEELAGRQPGFFDAVIREHMHDIRVNGQTVSRESSAKTVEQNGPMTRVGDASVRADVGRAGKTLSADTQTRAMVNPSNPVPDQSAV